MIFCLKKDTSKTEQPSQKPLPFSEGDLFFTDALWFKSVHKTLSKNENHKTNISLITILKAHFEEICFKEICLKKYVLR